MNFLTVQDDELEAYDQFAGVAMQALISKTKFTPEEVAVSADLFAAEMIKLRRKRENDGS